MTLDDNREARLHHFYWRVVRIAIVHADSSGHAIFVTLGAPAATAWAHCPEEEASRTRVNSMHYSHHQIGVMPCNDAVGDGRRERLEHGIDDCHRKRHPPAHRGWTCR